ncbi:Crp/Fnr family transcriptional regulator [Cupriavidus taiwanensis]|nr:Crp/Fnr family transcriptional regulator [Cupriavidus taiwanensis]SOZ10049.1 putative transcriptional regulator, Crp family [Cupriavidus taiwanensis]SOZ12217.1 putative transcriptional regulator, Crp family [Cupriavidus taiwanensis]SOZ43522.1 putative transcriptional regulator, Crp family [Cupriavidus taiwanensis]SPC17472.1 putative transcriptional regulator, Crp family [Cupriavidus taiwanensis]SPC22764.1 putative transcriptional regulator, Crp family [Cupriavidus taiwanensis]
MKHQVKARMKHAVEADQPVRALPRSVLASGWLRNAPPRVLDAVAHAARRQRFGDGAMIFARGDPPTYFCMVVSGRVRMSRVSSGGRESVYSVIGRGRWFGEISLLDGKPRTHDAFAVGNTELLVLGQRDFHRILATHPEGMQLIVQQICARLRVAFDHAQSAAQAPVDARMAARLLELADRTDHVVRISAEELGDMVSRSRQTVAKTLQAWQDAGLIRRAYRQIELLDPAALKRLARR